MITVSSNAKDIIRQLRTYKRELKKKEEELLLRLHAEGVDLANIKLATVQYDGTMNVQVDNVPHWESNPFTESPRLALSVVGDEITFIEFGSGVHYTEQHPEAAKFGMIRGTFGGGRGANPPWLFYDEGGNPGYGQIVASTKDGGVLVETYGNPPNRVVYDTGKELRTRVQDIAREVFADD